MPARQVHVWISGRVQGVFFRHHTQQEALMRGLKGWVRNLPDRRVEAVFQGDEESVQEMVSWCRHGPPAARVEAVEIVWETPEATLEGFGVRYA